jgi:hypothetical protein
VAPVRIQKTRSNKNAALDFDSNQTRDFLVSNRARIQVPELFKRIWIRRRIKE